MEQGIESLRNSEITLDIVKNLHRVLWTGVRGEEKNPGQFRTTQNALGSHDPHEARYVPPPPHFVSPAIANLERYIQSGEGQNDLLEIGIAHYQFETIHPFLDGNGRMGRLIITLMLYQRGLLPQPFLYFSSYFNRHRDEYVERLFGVSTRGAWEEWLEFFLDAVTEQANEAFIRSKKLLELKERYRKRYQDRRSETILGLIYALFDNPIVDANDVEEEFGVSNPTAHKAINQLVDDDVLEEITGKSRYRVYMATDIMRYIDEPLEVITSDAETMLTEAQESNTENEYRQSGLGDYS